MRIGTVLSYNTKEFGPSNGVVNELTSPSTVKCFDEHGGEYIVARGQGHKHKDQQSGFCTGLRTRFGIEVGPCQKSTFGADVVHAEEDSFAKKYTGLNKFLRKIKIGLPSRVTTS